MTNQYQNPGINNPGDAISVIADRQLTTDDDLVVITGGSPTLTLPDARVVRGIVLEIKSVTGTGVVNTLASQTIDGAATFSFVVAQQSLTVISDGSNWRITNNLGQVPSALTGTGRPIANANFVGQIYLDTAHGNRAYLATSVGNGEGDWKRTSAFDSRFELAPLFADFDDSAATPGGWIAVTSNGGTYGQASNGPKLSSPGVGRLAITNALDSLSIITNNRQNYVFGGGEAFNKWIINIEDEATAGEPYTSRWGYIDTITTAAPTDGIFWSISEASPNLIANVAVGGVTVPTNTNVAYDFGVNFHSYGIRVNSLGNSAEFFLDGTLLVTISAGLPSGDANVFGLGAMLHRTVNLGTTRGVLVDLCEATQDIDVQR